MSKAFGEYAVPTDAIAAILGTYPFSVGIFRELLQNSDDAKATKQVFILDMRNHTRGGLFHDKLGDTQGPALLAYNDAVFSDNDWDAIQSIHKSSKRSDTTKIGKYGIGFRSCYHLTDNPQILSGSHLALLDAHHDFTESGGIIIPFTEPGQSDKCIGHMRAFQSFLPDFENDRNHSFPGSIIRLPLRTHSAKSAISSKVVSAEEIQTLFEDFIREELEMSLLFLKHVCTVEIHEISMLGARKCLARAAIERGRSQPLSFDSGEHILFPATIKVQQEVSEWILFQSRFPEKDSAALLSYRLGRDVRPVLDKHKLLPHVSLALSIPYDRSIQGRLFTYLPLPIRTGFRRVHVHAPFALTPSRTNLASGTEVGIVRGSDDSVLVEWNRVLFDHYLPQTWVLLLLHHVSTSRLSSSTNSIWDLWPPYQPTVTTGDAVYWQGIPGNVLSRAIQSDAKLWPLLDEYSAAAKYANLDEALLVSSLEDQHLVHTLLKAGVDLIRPAKHVMDMIQLTPKHLEKVKIMGKRNVREQLVKLPRETIEAGLDSQQRETLTNYLVTEGPELLVDLPLLSSTSGTTITLQLKTEKDEKEEYTLLERTEYAVFSVVGGDHTIALHLLSSITGDVLRSQGAKTLNLRHLDVDFVQKFLKQPNPFSLDFTKPGQIASDAALDWLAQFWTWASTSSGSVPLLAEALHPLYLLPGHDGTLHQVIEGVFIPDEDYAGQDGVVNALKALRIPFLHAKIPTATVQAMRIFLNDRSLWRLLGPGNAARVLERSRWEEGNRLQTSVLLQFFCRALPESTRDNPLTDIQRELLRALPIFPSLEPSTILTTTTPSLVSTGERSQQKKSRFKAFSPFSSSSKVPQTPKTSSNVKPHTIPLPRDAVIYGIQSPMLSSTVLPILNSTIYLYGSTEELSIFPYISLPSATTAILNDLEILSLAAENVGSQPKLLQLAFMEKMEKLGDALPPKIVKTLSQIAFVPVLDGTTQAPCALIDPSSDLVKLFMGMNSRIPRDIRLGTSDGETKSFLDQIRKLGLLKSKLDDELIIEQIQHISDTRSITLARQLFELLYQTSYDITSTDILPDLKWIPTTDGLKGYKECLDATPEHRTELFDEVMPVVDEAIALTPALKRKFGWNYSISFSTMTLQLEKVLQLTDTSIAYRKLRALIQELAKRTLSDDELKTLNTIVAGLPWVPISPKRLSKIEYAVFDLAISVDKFCEIPGSLAEDEDVHRFLVRMGCSDRPSASVIIAELQKLRETASKDVGKAIQLLRALPLEISDADRARILVPDKDGELLTVPDVHYNDIGIEVFLQIEPDTGSGPLHIAHPSLNDAIAKHLRMKRVGLESFRPEKGAIDMGTQLVTSIRNTLKQYTEQQMLSEFFANAADAGATRFGIMLDEKQGLPVERLLTTAMRPFQACPSLMVYNNGVFTAKDFEGICRTGIGGKEGKSDTIGQFGLGSLSMFHFTEFVTILSGDKVLFLDPSKTLLPLENWASLLIPLSQIQKLYPDHLAPFEGVFEYSTSASTFYPGTIFRLPLRTEKQTSPQSILNAPRAPSYIMQHVIEPYKLKAQQSLLFTRIEAIATFRRDANGIHEQGWNVRGERKPFSQNQEDLTITFRQPNLWDTNESNETFKEKWEIFRRFTPIKELPEELQSLVETHRLRSPINVSMAVRTFASDSAPQLKKHALFSTLPLPVSTTLPVHLSASFILTPDRRNVRFDDSSDVNLESRYNRWLLADVAPFLYFELLESMLQRYNQNWPFWPGNTPFNDDDAITRVLVTAFYLKHLAKCSRDICASAFGTSTRFFSPERAIFLGHQPEQVTKILSLIPSSSFVWLPEAIHDRMVPLENMTFVQPTTLRDILLKQAKNTLPNLLRDGKLNINDFQALLDYLDTDDSVELYRLPLIPLADGTLDRVRNIYASMDQWAFVWSPAIAGRDVFPASSIVHPDFNAQPLLNGKYSVSKPTNAGIQWMIRERFSAPMDKLFGLTEDKLTWLYQFWEEYPSLGCTPELSSYPLIPTAKGKSAVSLHFLLNDPSAVVPESSTQEWLYRCLEKLGMSVIETNTLSPPSLKVHMAQAKTFTIDSLFRYFASILESRVPLLFLDLEGDEFYQFAQWTRERIGLMTVTDESKRVMRNLPIWPILRLQQGTSKVLLRTANDVQMLPYTMPAQAVSRFLHTPLTEFHTQLQMLGNSALTMNELWSLLRIPPILDNPEDRTAFKDVLTASLAGSDFAPERGLFVPNGLNRMIGVGELYQRHPLFISSFGSENQAVFLSDSIMALEGRLGAFGLKTADNLDLQTFVTCVRALNEDQNVTNSSLVQRAQALFRVYCNNLPFRTGANVEDYNRIDATRFIPRAVVRSDGLYVSEGSSYVKPLPLGLVAPNEVAVAQYAGVCWSQRAIILSEPDSHTLMRHPTLGIPTAEEVVDHLCVLTLRVAKDHSSNVYLLRDLQDTYFWLNAHQDEAADYIIHFHDQKLFLNVDDPATEQWSWQCADEMFFSVGRAEGSTVQLRTVRKFLTPYSDLLVIAGVEDIIYPTAPLTTGITSLNRLYSGFNKLRQEQQLTDVIFVCDESETRLPAHRFLLAATSSYLNDLFCGEFREGEAAASAGQPIEVAMEHSGASVEAVLEYLYTGVTSHDADFSTLELSDALDALDLSNYWGLSDDFSQHVQASIIRGNLLTPATYDEIAERAEMLNAKILKEACRFYEEENREAIMRLKGEITGPRRPKRLPKKYGPDTPARPSSWPREGSRPRRISKMFSRMFKKKEKPSSP